MPPRAAVGEDEEGGEAIGRGDRRGARLDLGRGRAPIVMQTTGWANGLEIRGEIGLRKGPGADSEVT